LKVDLLFHEHIISDPVLKIKDICRSSTNPIRVILLHCLDILTSDALFSFKNRTTF
jgi:hypothetical protein